MKITNQLQRIRKMNERIKSENTGSPKEFAEDLGISESHFYRCIEELQEMGIPIKYSRSRRTYFYDNNSELSFSYSLKLISDQGSKEILGGLKIIPSLLFFESERLLL